MSARDLVAEPLTAEAFRPFGDVIEARDAPIVRINGGMCDRFHDLARVEVAGTAARIGISVGHGRPYPLPLDLTLVERHPHGSQAFAPMTEDPFLVIVAPDENGVPGRPRVFLTSGRQGVNYPRNLWHGVLTPLGRAASFLIVDRVVGAEANLEEYTYPVPWRIVAV